MTDTRILLLAAHLCYPIPWKSSVPQVALLVPSHHLLPVEPIGLVTFSQLMRSC